MKKLLIACACMVVAAAAWADVIPAKSELTVAGNFARPKEGSTVYALDLKLGVPLNNGGNILLGPNLHLDSDQTQRAVGAVLHWNLLGTKKVTPFVGAEALYNVKEVAGDERYTVNGLAGIKVPLSKCGSGFQVYASKVIDGRGKDASDYVGNVGLLVRF